MSGVVSNIGFMQGRLSPLRNGRIQSFPWGNWENEFRQAEDLGFTAVEWTIDSERFLDNPLVTVAGQSEISQLSRMHGLLVPSVTCDYFMENPFWKSDSSLIRQNLIKILDGMDNIGARILVIPLVDNSSLEDLGQAEAARIFFESLEMELRTRDLLIAFESDFAPKALASFIDNFDPKIFGINYDIGNSASLGFDPKEEFSAYGSRIVNVHVKDRILGGSTVPLGKGSTDFETVFGLLVEYGYNGNLIMQTARSNEGKHEEVLIKYQKMIIAWLEGGTNVYP